MKIRAICLSKALVPYEAIQFAGRLTNSTNAKFVYSGMNIRGRKGRRVPKYYVVRLPVGGEWFTGAHEMMIEEKEVLDVLPDEDLRY